MMRDADRPNIMTPTSRCLFKLPVKRNGSYSQEAPGGRRGGGTPHMKVVRMLVVSLRGVNFGFWSHLGCSGQNAIIFSREGLV